MLHVLAETPPTLLEHEGSEDPATEARLDRELHRSRDRWIAHQEEQARPLFARAIQTLQASGADPAAVEAECHPSVDEVNVPRACIEAARDGGFQTIAVGRSSWPWYRELFRRHACHELLKHSEGLTVWVVE